MVFACELTLISARQCTPLSTAAPFNQALMLWCAFGSCKKKVVRAVFAICLKFAVKKVVEEVVLVVLNTITSSK